jgi:class 3 adenylate cyclase/tetratricopeptide (TPR) repeat protein
MICPKCQHENVDRTKFCDECATPLSILCAKCLAQLSPTAKFCSDCAHPVGLAPQSTFSWSPRFASPEDYTPKFLVDKIHAAKAIAGERKLITVLFADIKGSMELLDGRDAEEAQTILDPILERMIDAVHRYEGTVNTVMGDGIMALFGAPIAHEDHAVRASYAALWMQENVARYSDEVQRSHGVPVMIRVGLNSGEVIAGAIGHDLRLDYGVVGATVHLAARMEQMARPGSVLATADTIRLVEGFVTTRSLGRVPVKGLVSPTEVHEITGAGSARTRLQRAAMRGLTHFVGRDAEIRQLRRAAELASNRHGQVVALAGEAGVGKSRLLYEFTHSRHMTDWLTLETASTAYGKGTSYLPVIDLLKAYFKIQDRDNLTEIREKVTGKLLTLDRELEPTLPSLFGLLDVPVDDGSWHMLEPAKRRRATLDSVEQLLIREAQRQPLVLIFEDLQWIDCETQALLDSLVRSLGSIRLLLLVSCRPEYRHGWADEPFYTLVRTDALQPENIAELLDALLGRDSDLRPLKKLLVARGGGNPFFLEELVRSLAEEGALTGDRGHHRLRQPIETIQVPASVQTMLAARIDRLSAQDKHLLQVAAVVGKDVPLALLQPIADLPNDALQRGVERLQSAEFLYETGLYPDAEYSFAHALTHEVTYGGMLIARRRALHARIVDVIEALYRDRLGEQIERLAHHALRGDLHKKALYYLRQAGNKAAARFALQEGRVWLEQALRVLDARPQSAEEAALAIDIRFELRNCLHPLGHLELILDHIRKVEADAAFFGDQRRLGLASFFLCQYHRLLGDLEAAIEAGERAVTIADQLGDIRLSVLSKTLLGSAATARGDHLRATEILTATLEHISGDLVGDAMGTTGIISVFTRIYLVSSLVEIGEFTAAKLLAEEAIRIAESANHVYSRAFAYYGMGTTLTLQGHLSRGMHILETGLELCRSWKIPLILPLLGTSLGHAYCLSARPDDAICLMEEVDQIASAMQRRDGHAMLLVRLGEAYLQAFRVEDASRCARQALEFCLDNLERGHEAYALRLLGELQLNNPPALEECESLFRRAMARAEELNLRPLLAQCYLGLGMRLRRVNRSREADSCFTAALKIFRALDMPLWRDRVHTGLAPPL